MKAVIVEIKGRYAAALSDDGRISRILNQGYALGQVIRLESRASVPLKRTATWMAAAAAAVVVLATGGYVYTSPYAYVSLDVNPSVEYIVNRFDRVIGVEAMNEDGVEIIRDVALQNKSIDRAVRETLDQIASKGYFKDTKQNGLVIAASCKDEKASEKLALRLEQSAQEETGSLNAQVEVSTVTVSQERVQEAKDLGVTPGKLEVVKQLQGTAKDPETVDVKAWLSQPVVDIMNEIKASKQDPPQSSESGGESSESDFSSEEPSSEISNPPEEESKPASDPSGQTSTSEHTEDVVSQESSLQSEVSELSVASEASEPSLESSDAISQWPDILPEPAEQESSLSSESSGSSEYSWETQDMPKGKIAAKKQRLESEIRREGMTKPAN